MPSPAVKGLLGARAKGALLRKPSVATGAAFRQLPTVDPRPISSFSADDGPMRPIHEIEKWWSFAGPPPGSAQASRERDTLGFESLLSASRNSWQSEQQSPGWRQTKLPPGYQDKAGGSASPKATGSPNASGSPNATGSFLAASKPHKLQRMLPYFDVLWRQHEGCMQQFHVDPPSSISYASIPWPDVDEPNDLLRMRLEGGPGGKMDVASILRPLTLQWHPDKFQQRFGQAIQSKDRDRIMNRVTAIFQLVLSKKSAMNAE